MKDTDKLTNSEITHLITLIERNEEDGSYYAPREQYWVRSKRIKEKLRKLQAKPVKE